MAFFSHTGFITSLSNSFVESSNRAITTFCNHLMAGDKYLLLPIKKKRKFSAIIKHKGYRPSDNSLC